MSAFTLTIELGNDAMQTGADVGHALRAVADRLDYFTDREAGDVTPFAIRDLNGNTVGAWQVTP